MSHDWSKWIEIFEINSNELYAFEFDTIWQAYF